jgi:hypothetical protein
LYGSTAARARVLGVHIPESFCQTYPECKDSINVMADDDDPFIAYEASHWTLVAQPGLVVDRSRVPVPHDPVP